MYRFARCTTLVPLLWFCSGAFADELPVINDKMQSVILGSGYSTLEERALDRCVKFTPGIALVSESKGGITNVFAESIADRERLRNALGITVSTSFDASIADVGSFGGDAKLNYFHSATFEQNNFYAVVRIDVKSQDSTLQSFDLKENAKQLLASSDANSAAKFQRACGDRFISGYSSGGRLTAVFQMTGVTKEEKTTLEATFAARAKAMVASGNMDLNVKDELEKYKQTNRLVVTIFRVGGSEELPSGGAGTDQDMAAFITKLLQFPADVLKEKNSYPLSIVIKDYHDLVDVQGHELVDVTKPSEVIGDYVQRYNDAVALFKQIRERLAKPEEFENVNLDSLNNADAALVKLLNKLRSLAKGCWANPDDPAQCEFLPADQLAMPAIALPRRKNPYALAAGPECGEPISWDITEQTVCSPATDTRTAQDLTFDAIALSKEVPAITGFGPGARVLPVGVDVDDKFMKLLNQPTWECLRPLKDLGPDEKESICAQRLDLASFGGDYTDRKRWLQETPRHRQVNCKAVSKTHECRTGPRSMNLWKNPITVNSCVDITANLSCVVTLSPIAGVSCSKKKFYDPSRPVYPTCRHPSHGLAGN